MTLRSRIKKSLPWPALYLYRKIYYFPKDVFAALSFIFNKTKSPTSFTQRLKLVAKFYYISYVVDCPHTEHELISISRQILNLGSGVPGVVLEAGAFYGGSTSKLSLVAELCDRKLEVFDSFEGMPTNSESGGKSIFGREHHFPKGSHAVGLEQVKKNISDYGNISRCNFHKGWFSETMPKFHEQIATACINVDLAQSTKDCLKYIYPLVSKGGIVFSQDGHFPWIISLLSDDLFWKNDIGISKPAMDGLGKSKVVTIHFC